MDPGTISSDIPPFISGGGELGDLTRSYDWKNSTLGTPDKWPRSLLSTLGILLHSSFPMFLFWGKDLTCFYNDAYRPSLGINGKHPAVGKKAMDVWPEIWPFIGPLIEQVMKTAEPVWFEDQLLPIYRNGNMEDVYWTFSYSPVYGDDGSVNGVFVTCTETTEKVRNVKKLLESQKRFQALVREATVGIIVLIGEENTIEIVNEAYGKLINRKTDELLGKPLFSIIPETEPYFKGIIDNVRNTGNPFSLHDHPYYVETGSGKNESFLNVVYQPYSEDDGTISGVMVLCQDVTDQVLARRKTEESELRVRSIVENAPFPIGVYAGKEMRIELANQSILDVWGKGNDVIGKIYSDILPELDNQEIFAQLDHVYTTGEPFHARNQRVDLIIDGNLISEYFNYSFTPLYNAAGEVYGVMNTAAVVTDLETAKQKVEKSEENFRNMILQSPVAMCIMLGPEHIVDIANQAMIELWGKPVSEVMYKPVFEGLPDARSQGLEDLIASVYNTGESFRADERPVNLIRNGKEETVYQNFVYEPYRGIDGSVLGVLAVSIDVTDQVLARQKIEYVVAERTKALAESNSNLAKSNAELAQFAYIASHDLQEPVRKVSTFTQMLETNLGTVDDRSKNYINKIKTSSSRMLALIKDVLAYSELSRINQEHKKVDLEKVVDDIKTDFELLIEQKNAQVTVSNLPELDAIPLHMSQLFSNLIFNALKFSRPGMPAEISIVGSEASKEEIASHAGLNNRLKYYKVEIKDNGIGFEQEYAGQIFNIFQRLHGRKDYEGTGIGLAMCQKIVQNHFGEIYATSQPAVGSTFTIILPVTSKEMSN